MPAFIDGAAMPPPPDDFDQHRKQDYQSYLMHIEAVRMLRTDPSLALQLLATLHRWKETADPRILPLFDAWQRILEQSDWAAALSDSQRGTQLRQASPMATLLDQRTRLHIIREVGLLAAQSQEAKAKKGGLSSTP